MHEPRRWVGDENASLRTEGWRVAACFGLAAASALTASACEGAEPEPAAARAADGGREAGSLAPGADAANGVPDASPRALDAGVDAGEAGTSPAYTPLVYLDFEQGEDEQDAAWPKTSGGPMAFDTAHAKSGSKAMRVRFRHLRNGYGGYQDLPAAISPGETVWYRTRLFIPATTSFSYGDTSGDGFGFNKFLVLSRKGHAGARMYVQPKSAYKIDFGGAGFEGTGLRVNHDSLGDAYCTLMAQSYALPRDRWFALQMAWHVATDASAWIRVWSDETFVGECAGAGVVPADYAVQSFGIGDYWNGGAWIEGGSTADFWMDDLVVTKETPNTLDDGGRPFIHPAHF